MPAVSQICAEELCDEVAAYTTRTKPAFCVHHIEAKLRQGGLEPLEPFTKPTAWQLSRCLECGLDAHYRFEYVQDNNSAALKTCRACYWRDWAVMSRAGLGDYGSTGVTVEAARSVAEANGYTYLRPLTDLSLSGDPHYVRCDFCSRLSAQRLSDIGFGCSCLSSSKRTSTARPATRTRALFKDSDSVAIEWWDRSANTVALWETVSVTARRTAAWICPTCEHRFIAPISDMMKYAVCPLCREMESVARSAERFALGGLSVADVPELLADWAELTDPSTVPVVGSRELRQFRCSAGHRPRADPEHYLSAGCPSCRSNETRLTNIQAAKLDAELTTQWHPDMNAVDISRVLDTSKRTIWWKDPVCGHEWAESPRERHKRPRWRCPQCKTRLGSLAWHYPDIAAEWSPSNPLSAWQVMSTGQTTFTPAWVCPTASSHVWESTLSGRVAGATCPECRISGKSAIELVYRDAAEVEFGAAASGRSIRDARFQRRLTWTVDIGVQHGAASVAIEYDGAYWHEAKREIDTDKSMDLLAADFAVVRLREHPLQPLDISHPRYKEMVVYASAPQPQLVMREVAAWSARVPDSTP